MKAYTVKEIESLTGTIRYYLKMITAPEQLGVASDSDITFVETKKRKTLVFI
jgi:hypothetical protein